VNVNGQKQPYRVDWSRVKSDVRKLRDEALNRDPRAQSRLANALREITARLESNPASLGEPKYSLHQIGMSIHIAFYDRYRFVYGIQEKSRQVFIRDFEDQER
jgi:vacuolar-type H+-ATPase catalytic subunit A/Vma1